jgi:ribonuclease Z
MAKIIILGSSNAIADETHENAYLIIVGRMRKVLVDSPHNPILRLKKVGIGFRDITDLVLTHFHPDHVSGIPLLLMDMWLRGRKRPLNIYGLPHALNRLENLMDAFSWENWPDFFPVKFKRLPPKGINPLLDCEDFSISASQVCHMIPTIGLRVEFKASKRVVTYSCDTAPCQEVIDLAQNADVLIHEASGAFMGHTSAAQAADVATKAGAKELYLIHYPTGDFWQGNLLRDARSRFAGKVALAEDLMTFDFE